MKYYVLTAPNDPMEFVSTGFVKALQYMQDPFSTGEMATEFTVHVQVEGKEITFTMIPGTASTTPAKPTMGKAPLPETPKNGVHCHILRCDKKTDKRGFFCCGGHGCKH
jgi:hypothetical protein